MRFARASQVLYRNLGWFLITGVICLLTLPSCLNHHRKAYDFGILASEVRRLGGDTHVPEGSGTLMDGVIWATVDFAGKDIGDDELARLVSLKGFRVVDSLILEGTQVTDKGISSLIENETLSYLNLNDTGITDLSAIHLSKTSLDTLDLNNTNTTERFGLIARSGKNKIIVIRTSGGR